jgi:hypothetical protein
LKNELLVLATDWCFVFFSHLIFSILLHDFYSLKLIFKEKALHALPLALSFTKIRFILGSALRWPSLQ